MVFVFKTHTHTHNCWEHILRCLVLSQLLFPTQKSDMFSEGYLIALTLFTDGGFICICEFWSIVIYIEDSDRYWNFSFLMPVICNSYGGEHHSNMEVKWRNKVRNVCFSSVRIIADGTYGQSFIFLFWHGFLCFVNRNTSYSLTFLTYLRNIDLKLFQWPHVKTQFHSQANESRKCFRKALDTFVSSRSIQNQLTQSQKDA